MNWLIAYIMPAAGVLGPGPFFWQATGGTVDEVIQKFERESYSKEVTYFTLGSVHDSGVRLIGSYRFTSHVRKYERTD